MGGAQRGDAALHFYEANLGLTLALTVIEANAVQTTDAEGALPPGRYLLHINDTTNDAQIWVKTVPFKKGQTIVLAAGVPAMPFRAGFVVGLEFNVRRGDNDRIVAIASGPGIASGTLYITQISRGA